MIDTKGSPDVLLEAVEANEHVVALAQHPQPI
jgi:hypothetical protein